MVLESKESRKKQLFHALLQGVKRKILDISEPWKVLERSPSKVHRESGGGDTMSVGEAGNGITGERENEYMLSIKKKKEKKITNSIFFGLRDCVHHLQKVIKPYICTRDL